LEVVLARTNVLFLLVDCLRADVCYGWRGRAQTPHIDALIRRGVAFDQMISTTSTTSPCVTSLLTGVYPFEHGVRALSGQRLAQERATLPGALSKAGYRTFAEVTGPLSELLGLDQEFDHYRYRDKNENVYTPWFSELLQKLRTMEEPWFMLLHLWEAHGPYVVPPGFNDRRYGLTAYERAISALDAKLGEVLETLPPDTLVVLHGDHGENYTRSLLRRVVRKAYRALGRPRMFRMQDLAPHGYHIHDYLVRVPLVISGPGVPAGVRVEQQVRQVDVAPTILELSGAGELPTPIHGTSLAGKLRGEDDTELPAYMEACGVVLQQHGETITGLRTPPWKLTVRSQDGSQHFGLYDLRQDPDERTNLASDMPEKVREMRALLEEISRPLGSGSEAQQMSDEEMELLERRLSDLGYIE
jgi:arylsulfatase A-like enzyme